jgi:aspartate/methionine/tyrosine aminotransferase
MMSREALVSLIGAAEGAGIRFISDEIYHGLDYAFPQSPPPSAPQALVINSFSKYFCMTGWRVGWMVVPEPLVRLTERLQQNLRSRCRRCRRSPPRPLSREPTRWRRSSMVMKKTAAS